MLVLAALALPMAAHAAPCKDANGLPEFVGFGYAGVLAALNQGDFLL